MREQEQVNIKTPLRLNLLHTWQMQILDRFFIFGIRTPIARAPLGYPFSRTAWSYVDPKLPRHSSCKPFSRKRGQSEKRSEQSAANQACNKPSKFQVVCSLRARVCVCVCVFRPRAAGP